MRRFFMGTILSTITMASVLGGTAPFTLPQEFTVQMESSRGKEIILTTFYVQGDKCRMDSTVHGRIAPVITDFVTQKSYYLQPETRTFKAATIKGHSVFKWWAPPADAVWTNLPDVGSYRLHQCRFNVAGKPVSIVFWVDSTTMRITRMQLDGATVQLRDFTPEIPDSSVFEIPKTYTDASTEKDPSLARNP